MPIIEANGMRFEVNTPNGMPLTGDMVDEVLSHYKQSLIQPTHRQEAGSIIDPSAVNPILKSVGRAIVNPDLVTMPLMEGMREQAGQQREMLRIPTYEDFRRDVGEAGSITTPEESFTGRQRKRNIENMFNVALSVTGGSRFMKKTPKEIPIPETPQTQGMVGIVYRAESGSPRGDVKGIKSLGDGVYVTPKKEIAEIYGKPEAFKIIGNPKLINESSKEYRGIASRIDSEGNFKTRDERDLAVGKAVKSAGYDGVVGKNNIDGIVIFDNKFLKKVNFSPFLDQAKGMSKEGGLAKPKIDFPRLETRPVKFSEPINIRDLSGQKKQITPEPEMFISKVGKNYEIHDGQTVKVSPNVAKDFGNRYGLKVPKVEGEFAPELKEVEEVVKGVSKEKPQTMYRAKQGGGLLTEQEYNSLTVEQKNAFNKIGEKFTKEIKNPVNPTKFSQYQEPGGENYREVLIKVPKEFNRSRISELEKEAEEIMRTPYDIPLIERQKRDARLSEIRTEQRSLTGEGSQFKSSHWDEPNVISHLRMNDRVTPDGKKVTFLEEIQSDWAREARKGTITSEKLNARANRDSLLKRLQTKYGTKDMLRLSDKWTDAERVEFNRLNNIATEIDSPLTPSHPLLKNWQELSLKRALKEAVDNDSEYLSWVTGEQTANRYDLSKHLDEVHWLKQKDGAFAVSGIKDGKNIVSKIDIPANELDAVIGKDVANKILNDKGTGGKLSGLDLKVGGEWAKNLYDKQIPNILKDLTGQKVEVIEFKMPARTVGTGDFITEQQAIRITPEIRTMVKGMKK